jgi:hypothetical protein
LPSTQAEQVKSLPAIPTPFQLPFYYSSLFNVGLYYLLPAESLKPYIRYNELELATFDEQACLTFNFQSYTGQFPFGTGVTQEIEVQMLTYPKSQKDQVPSVSFKEFLLGEEQTRLIGNHRIHVPCDAIIALLAGKLIFDEPKFPATFETALPSLNDQQNGYPNKWNFKCFDQSHMKEIGDLTAIPNDLRQLQYKLLGEKNADENLIVDCDMDLTGMHSLPGNFSPITEYGHAEGKLTAARWNILQPLSTYFFDAQKDAKRVTLKFGKSAHKMRTDLETLIGKTSPYAAFSFQSAPDAIQSRPFFV